MLKVASLRAFWKGKTDTKSIWRLDSRCQKNSTFLTLSNELDCLACWQLRCWLNVKQSSLVMRISFTSAWMKRCQRLENPPMCWVLKNWRRFLRTLTRFITSRIKNLFISLQAGGFLKMSFNICTLNPKLASCQQGQFFWNSGRVWQWATKNNWYQ